MIRQAATALLPALLLLAGAPARPDEPGPELSAPELITDPAPPVEPASAPQLVPNLQEALQLCEGGDWRACAAAARMYRTGQGPANDPVRAAELDRTACEGGVAEACRWLAFAHRVGKGVPRDPARAVELYRAACDGGDLPGCASLGTSLVFSVGAPRDVPAGMAILEKACDAGGAGACVQLGEVYDLFVDGPPDPARALLRYRQACRLGEVHGCRHTADRIVPRGPPISIYDLDEAPLDERVREAAERCEAGETGHCAFAGEHLLDGEGVERDLARAEVFLARGCELNGYACADLGSLYRDRHHPPAPVRAASAYERACDAGISWGCYHLARMLAEGAGVPADPSRAILLHARACAASWGWSCYDLGVARLTGSGVPRDERLALELFDRSCTERVGRACYSAALLTASTTLRRKYLRRGCRLKDRDACEQLRATDFLESQGDE